MTSFAAALQLCGLSHREAAEFFVVRRDTVSSWASGRNPVPAGVWVQLAQLFEAIQDAADRAAGLMAADGIDARSWSHIEAALAGEAMPQPAESVAGAMALLMAISHLGYQIDVPRPARRPTSGA